MSWDDRIIGIEELSPYLHEQRGSGFDKMSVALLDHQREHWPQLAEGYNALWSAQATKNVRVEESEVLVQYNPKRIRSTAAAVDKVSIGARTCFLCPWNLPDEEKGIAYGEKLVILCNPFPIREAHLSIVHREHIEQKLDGNIEVLLDLARDLGRDFLVLYNGPECGASAPDHLHFQACSRALLPLEQHLYDNEPARAEDCAYCEETASQSFELFTLGGCGRSVVVFRGGNREEVAQWVYNVLNELSKNTDRAEPLVNLISIYDTKLWTVYLFPRSKHRPSCFYASGDERLTVSPGAIDMAGILVVPEREHFERIDAARAAQIFAEVSMNAEVVNDLIDGLCSLPEAEESAW